MTLRFNSYRFYFRLWFCLLPSVAFSLAAYARFNNLPWRAAQPGLDSRFYLIVCLLTTLVWLIVAEHNRLFHIDELFQENTGIRKTVAAVGSTYLTVICILFFYRQQNMSRLFFPLSAILLFTVTLGSRMCFRSLLRSRHSRRRLRVLIVGADSYALKVANRMAGIPFTPSEVVAHLRVPGQQSAIDRIQVFDFEAIHSWQRVLFDEVVIALPPSHLGLLANLVAQLEPLHVPIRAVLDLAETPIVRDRLFQLGDLQFLDLATTPLEAPAYFALKRAFDVVLSLLVLVCGTPLFALIALAIKLSSPGPVLFGQERVGLNGMVFTMYKFRTMTTAPKSVSDESHTSDNESRKTIIGSWLRKMSLDELPQFINVLRGDMSVVGPRPERPFFVEKYTQEVLNYNTRHRLKVGITGWAQVNGWRGNTSIERRIDADLYYLQNWTFWLDLRIVIMTIFKGMVADHAY